MFGFAIAMVVLFLISCILTATDASLASPVAEESVQVTGAQGSTPGTPWVEARSAVLVESESGRVLFERNSNLQVPIASTTKMVTALVVREQLDLNEEIPISQEAASIGEQEIWLEAGEVLTVEQLLNALLVQSANDAAYALAQHTTGSIDSFANLMNDKASEVGANNSRFKNPHGLDEPGHFSTAYDLALIGREVLKDQVLAEMVSKETYEIPWPGHPYPRTCMSHNEILDTYDGATGIKTGYTEDAGKCLVASAERDGTSLIAVILDSESRVADASRLLDYGFQATERLVVVPEGASIGRSRVSAFPRRYVDVVSSEDVTVVSVKGANDLFQVKTYTDAKTGGSVKGGTQLGRIECFLGGELAGEGTGVAVEDTGGSGIILAGLAFIWYSICWMGRILIAPFTVF